MRLTRHELAEFCAMRKNHYIRGIGSIDDAPRYRRLESAAEEYIQGLTDADERRVMELLYLQLRSVVAAAMLMHYSERQVQRIRARVLSRLEE